MRYEVLKSSLTPLYYIKAGKGRPLVLFHGFGASNQGLSPLIDALAESYTVIVPQLYASWNAGPAMPDLLQRLTSQIHELVSELHLAEKPLVMGYSMGAVMALSTVSQSPGAYERLIIVDGFLTQTRASYLSACFRLSLCIAHHILNPSDIRDTLPLIHDFLASAVRYPKAIARHFYACANADGSALLGRNATPTLILWGKDDTVARPSAAYKLQDMLSGSVLEMSEGDHLWGILHADELARIFQRRINA